MLAAGFSAQDLLRGFDECKLLIKEEQRVRYSRGLNPFSIRAASVFIRFLQQEGELPLPVSPPSASDLWPILGEFRSWMCEHRGLAEATLDVYEEIVVGLLNVLGDDPRAYSVEALRAFVLDRARPHKISRAKSIVVAIRSFCRFLSATKRCSPGLEHGIPGFASCQLSSVPRFLVPADVEQLIGSCRMDTLGIRDKAVLLLLARLGLRASEVAQLKFGDIDWRNGTITICGKGRRQELLPLPQEVGDAILLYLNKGRPSLQVPEVFTSVLAPLRPLTRTSVSSQYTFTTCSMNGLSRK